MRKRDSEGKQTGGGHKDGQDKILSVGEWKGFVKQGFSFEYLSNIMGSFSASPSVVLLCSNMLAESCYYQ